MRRLKALLAVFILPVVIIGAEWTRIGPEEISVNDYFCFGGGIATEVLCVSDGIYVTENLIWTRYSFGNLPCWHAVQLDPVNILVIMGDGTYSDGIYKFSMIEKTFEITEFAYKPKFILYCQESNSFYAGFEGGLLHSFNGIDWDRIDLFEGEICASMMTCGEYYVVSTVNSDSTSSRIFYSSDSGINWYESSHPSPPVITSMTHDDQNIIYGIYPGLSWSSGIWSSKDYGETWEPEYYSPEISCIYYYGDIFVAWGSPLGLDEGVALFDPTASHLYFMTGNLPNLYVNNLSHNPLINCINVVCCTDSGAYMTCDIPVDVRESGQINPGEYVLENNYPNPFNPSTTISYYLPEKGHVVLIIYDFLGRKITLLIDEQQEKGIHSILVDGEEFSSGVYFYNIRVNDFSQTKKMMILR